MKKIIFATFALSCPINSSLAEPLDFPSLPLFMGEPVTQNAFILLDDSGSMDWEIVTGRYWDPCAYDPNFSDSYNNIPICGTLIDNYGLMRTFANKTYRNFSYIYANNDNLYGSANNCTLPEYNTLESCSIVHLSDWRMLSSSLNLLYYNPTVTYLPWPGNCNQNTDKDSAATCKNAEFTAARAHPKTGNIGFNLIKDLSKNNLASYHVWIDNKGFNVADKRPLRASKLNVTDTPNQVVDLWDSHLQIVFKDNNTVELTQHYYQPTEKDIGHKTEKIATLSDTKACYNILGPDITQPTATNGTGCQTILQAQQNFANWYQYHRKKSYVANNALAVLISKQPTFKFGLTTLNQSDKFFIEIPSSSSIIHYQENNQNLLNQLWDIPVVANNTPLRTGLDKVGQYYAGALPNKKSPITSSCQKNMALLLTDGYWNEVNLSNKISDTDKDNIPFTLSDIARY